MIERELTRLAAELDALKAEVGRLREEIANRPTQHLHFHSTPISSPWNDYRVQWSSSIMSTTHPYLTARGPVR